MGIQKILSQSDKSPKSIVKIVLSISVALLVMWLFLVSRMDTSAGTPAANANEKIEQTQQLRTSLLKTGEAESSANLQNQEQKKAQTQTVAKKESSAMFQNAFVTFLVMITLMGGIWLWVKRKDNAATAGAKTPDRDLGGHALADGIQLKFIEINKEVWVMGVAESAVNLLHRIPKEEWLENEMELNGQVVEHESVQKAGGKGDFKSLYKFFTN